jgi:hypothetical protein
MTSLFIPGPFVDESRQATARPGRKNDGEKISRPGYLQVAQLPPEHPAQPEPPDDGMDGAKSPPAPPDLWRQRDMSFFVSDAAQAGQGGLASPKTSSSNSRPHFSQTNSYMGMVQTSAAGSR